MQPQFEDERTINPFDMWKGWTSVSRYKQSVGIGIMISLILHLCPLWRFEDAKLEEIWKSQHSLKEFTDPANFKSYEQLERDSTLC